MLRCFDEAALDASHLGLVNGSNNYPIAEERWPIRSVKKRQGLR